MRRRSRLEKLEAEAERSDSTYMPLTPEERERYEAMIERLDSLARGEPVVFPERMEPREPCKPGCPHEILLNKLNEMAERRDAAEKRAADGRADYWLDYRKARTANEQ